MARNDPPQPALDAPGDYVDLADYRRRVHALYGEVRARYATDPVGAHGYWRETRDALFRTHPQSALDAAQRSAFAGLRYYPYDPALAFRARLVESQTSGLTETGASSGDAVPFVRAGAVDLPFGRLQVYWLTGYGGGLFLPFRDATCGHATYGGGRYLLDTAKGADLGTTPDGELILDFNFAYHPSCHYDPIWACPLAPSENWLTVPVEAGERAYRAYRLEVRTGDERGARLVTLDAIPAETQIGSYAGARRLPVRSRFTIQVGEHEHIDDLGVFRSLNHSCDPSARVDVGTLTVHTLRALQPGEELTYFYPSTEWEMAEPFDCLCGAPRCLGRITGATDLPREARR